MKSERAVIEDAIRSLIKEKRASIPNISATITNDYSNTVATVTGIIGAIAGFVLFGSIGLAGSLLFFGVAVNAAIPAAIAGATLGALSGKLAGRKIQERTPEALAARLDSLVATTGLSGRTYSSIGLTARRVHSLVDASTGKVYAVQDQFTVGRDETCSVFLDSPTVSRIHAKILISGGAFSLNDLGSTNGTFINGVRIVGVASCPVGSTIHFGEHMMTLQCL